MFKLYLYIDILVCYKKCNLYYIGYYLNLNYIIHLYDFNHTNFDLKTK